MTNIYQLPRELLSAIFRNFKTGELIRVQHVCRAWYLPAHVLLLEDICLYDEDDFTKFTASIDRNANTSYLDAVKKIKISSIEGYGGVACHFDKDSIEKLICRFRNIKYVHIQSYAWNCLVDFDEEVCHTIEKKCPKLEYFKVMLDKESNDEDRTMNRRTIYRLRSLVTDLFLDNVGSASEFGGLTNFITSFPRLQDMTSVSVQFWKFEDYLPIFEHLTKLRSICVTHDVSDEEGENFAESFL